jgi:topoisomerase-4 subunit A
LESQWHTISLERIFIENRIYRDIEEKTTWDDVISTIDIGLDPFKKNLKKEVSVDDIKKLTEIPIRKISKFDLNKVKEKLNTIEITIKEVKNNLNHIIDYTIQYFTHLKKHYGKERKRKTVIEEFDDLDKKKISIKNQKLYVNKEEGFIGTSLKKDEFISDCSDLDDVIVFTKEGIMKVVKVDSKVFIGKDILHVSLFNSDIKEKTYNLIYRDGKNGTSFMKRFKVSGVIRDKEYNLTQGKESSELLYFSSNTKGVADLVTIHLRKRASIKKIKWEVDFADLAIKGRDSKGNIVTKYTIRKVSYREKNSIEKRIKKIDEIEVNGEEQVSNDSEENQTKLKF